MIWIMIIMFLMSSKHCHNQQILQHCFSLILVSIFKPPPLNTYQHNFIIITIKWQRYEPIICLLHMDK